VALLQNAVERKVPVMIEFLNNDYDDVSAAILEFAKEYIHVSIDWNVQCCGYDSILNFCFLVW